MLTLSEVQRYKETNLLVESAMEFYSFYDNKPKRKELEFFGLSATILDRNYYKAYNYIRWVNAARCPGQETPLLGTLSYCKFNF